MSSNERLSIVMSNYTIIRWKSCYVTMDYAVFDAVFDFRWQQQNDLRQIKMVRHW